LLCVIRAVYVVGKTDRARRLDPFVRVHCSAATLFPSSVVRDVVSVTGSSSRRCTCSEAIAVISRWIVMPVRRTESPDMTGIPGDFLL
jgi:hypothetical protein